MDVFSTIAGGMNPSDLLNAYPGLYVSMHVKDMKNLLDFLEMVEIQVSGWNCFHRWLH